MELAPRYDGPAILRFDGPLVDVVAPLIRQRRRLGKTLDELDAAQWSSPSRCAAEEPDELAACLRYAGALGPMLYAISGSTYRRVLVLDGTDPSLRVVIEAGETVVVRDGLGDLSTNAVRLTGGTVDLIEALSQRAPMPHPIAVEDQWMVDGVAKVFETAPSP